jgi:hypothetical protein
MTATPKGAQFQTLPGTFAAQQLAFSGRHGHLLLLVGVVQQNQPSALDKSCYDRWRELPEGDQDYRIAALTGHPRSGSTLVEQMPDSS